MLLYRLTTAWRRIVNTKLYSLFNVLGLAIGLVVSIIIFLLLQYEFSFDTFHPAGALAFSVALFVTANQAWKLASANPVDNLRAE